MALSQDEQRMLAEIERRLAADDPGLASCLTTFRRPGPGTVLRSPRARIIGSLFTVLLVAMVSLMVYAMVPFRAHMPAARAAAGVQRAGQHGDLGRDQQSAKPHAAVLRQRQHQRQVHHEPERPDPLRHGRGDR